MKNPISIYFSCPIFDLDTDLNFLKSTVIPDGLKFRFVIDTNVLIYIRELIINSSDEDLCMQHKMLIEILDFSTKHNIPFDYTIAVNEAARSTNNSKINLEKANFDSSIMSLIQQLPFAEIKKQIEEKRIKITQPKKAVKDESFTTKFPLEIPNCDLQRTASVFYCGLIKLYLIDKRDDLDLHSKYFEFINFCKEDLRLRFNLLSNFALLYFGKNKEVKKILKLKKKTSGQLLHSFWNSSVDLSTFYLSTHRMNPAPIFLTADKNLNKFYDSFKLDKYYLKKDGTMDADLNSNFSRIKINNLKHELSETDLIEFEKIDRQLPPHPNTDLLQTSVRIKSIGIAIEKELINNTFN